MDKNTSKLIMFIMGAMTLFVGVLMGERHEAQLSECYLKLVDTHNYGVMFGGCGPETKGLVFCGLVQTDYNFISVDNGQVVGTVNDDGNPISVVRDPTDRHNFLMRRVRIGLDADLGNGWSSVVNLDFSGNRTGRRYSRQTSTAGLASIASSPINATASSTRDKHGIVGIDKAYIEKKHGGNTFRAGYQKVNFGREENTSSRDLKAIERSIATRYFNSSVAVGNISGSPLGVGSRYVGLFMDGEYNGIGYGFSVVNGFQGNGLSSLQKNELGVFGNLYYAGEFNCIDIEVGVTGGYKPKGNNTFLSAVHYGGPGDGDPRRLQRGSTAVINPYILAKWERFSVLGEFLGADVEHGAVDALTDAKPYGITIIGSFMVNEELELVGRYSSIDTDFRGTGISAIVPGAPNTSTIRGANTEQFPLNPTQDIYENAFAGYVGLNYYMMHRFVKFSLGYEYLQFKDRFNSRGANGSDGTQLQAQTIYFNDDKSTIHAVRARLQLVF